MTSPLKMKCREVLRSLAWVVLLALSTQAAFGDTISTPFAQYGHGRLTTNVAYSPDGMKFLAGSIDGKAQLFDTGTGALLQSFTGHSSALRCVAFSPDGTRVLTGSDDMTAKLWDASTGAAAVTFTGHAGAVRSAAFSPDGTKVLTGSLDSSAKLWNAATGAVIRTLADTEAVSSVAISPDGTKALTGPHTTLWNMATGAVIRDIGTSANGLAFSPDGTKVLIGASDSKAHLYNAATGAEILSFVGHTYGVCSVAFSPDGTEALTGAGVYDTTAKLWDVATGDLIRSFRGHTVGASSVAFSPDGTRVLTGSRDFWDGTDFYYGDCMVKLWTAATGAETRTFTAYSGCVQSVAFSPDGAKVLAGSLDGRATLWNTVSRTPDRVFTDAGDLFCVAFTPDGTRAVTGSGSWDSPTVKLWNTSTGAVARSLPMPGPVYSMAISPDGTKVLTWIYLDQVRLWDVATGAELRSFSTIGHVAFSPDGAKVLTGFTNTVPETGKTYGVTKLWNAVTGALVNTFTGPEGSSVGSVAFSPDGTQLLTGPENTKVNNAMLWSASSGSIVRTFSGHTGWVPSVAFSPDGTKVLTGGGDTTARLWDPATGSLLRTFSGHVDALESVAFSPDGTRVLTGSADGTTKLWPVTGAGGNVSVPNVTGQTLAAAQTAIAAAGLATGTVTQQSSATVAAGLVISPNPAAGTQVAFGSTVDLVVSSGPPPAITGSIVINGNRSATSSTEVMLALAWSGGAGTGVTRMRFSNDGATWSAWEALAATRAYTLPNGDGHKTVRVQYMDKMNNRSSVFSDYIRLDATPPTGSIIISGGATTTTTRAVTLNLTWADAGAGVSRMRFSDDGAHWTAWTPPAAAYPHTLPAGLGYHTVRVQYLDGANNYSPVYNDYVKLVAP